MKKFLQIFLFLVLAVFLTAGNAFAITLGTNITISDQVHDGSGNVWYSDREDQEVEPGCVRTQIWDLEGFFLNGTTLTMVGGFDFKNGVDGIQSGDIFIDTDGDAQYGTSNTGDQTGNGIAIVANTFGYEYALRLDFGVSSNTYTVHKLDGSSTTTVYYEQNEESNPWRWDSGGSEKGTYGFGYNEVLSNSAVGGLLGDTHYAVALNLDDFLNQDEIDNFMVHFTMECGNDNLMGKNPVPEPASILLVGAGLIGLIGYNRKRYNKKIQ